MMSRCLTLLLLLLAISGLARADDKKTSPPKSPLSSSESLKHMRLAPGLRIDLALGHAGVGDFEGLMPGDIVRTETPLDSAFDIRTETGRQLMRGRLGRRDSPPSIVTTS